MTISEDASQDTAGPHLINAMREQIQARIQNLTQSDREVVQRLRMVVRGAQVDISSIFTKFAARGSDKLSQDELLIAMSRISDDIHLGDIKDLYRILIGVAPGGLAGFEDVRVPINEVV